MTTEFNKTCLKYLVYMSDDLAVGLSQELSFPTASVVEATVKFSTSAHVNNV
jgi:hypothetical protein